VLIHGRRWRLSALLSKSLRGSLRPDLSSSWRMFCRTRLLGKTGPPYMIRVQSKRSMTPRVTRRVFTFAVWPWWWVITRRVADFLFSTINTTIYLINNNFIDP
jgi:hypothetical protein